VSQEGIIAELEALIRAGEPYEVVVERLNELARNAY
jgi:hypothetical protein